ncbi:Cof-type HAD-IIB family hydrolase [Alkaliphilus serpentinus]|uniref:HAD family phosphatase n=1 Tax=Alkaliphilus serpentinus TaxID=1482731 RepID=A0A833M963_9FIRM|nr:Cof-type HAD-IIB family hydrolase [Alkaliphilus serpentinus]KAB3529157.1 HAD family phosphatase [Alkaliphilus serpentinus]
MNFKLIVVDMDGTLLDRYGEVSNENKRALKDAKDAGVEVAIATGRIFTSARFYAKLLETNTPIIACNGALIRNYHSNEVIHINNLNHQDAFKIMEICRNNQLYYHFYDQDKLYVDGDKVDYLKGYYWKDRGRVSDAVHIMEVPDTLSFVDKTKPEILKFVMVDEDKEKLAAVRLKFKEVSTVDVDKSWYNNLEVMNKGVSKGRAIASLSRLLGVNKEEIIAFGDNFNDLSMKNYVKTFVAMANGEEEVKAQAHYITDSNDESGVAKGIDKFIFGRNILL